MASSAPPACKAAQNDIFPLRHVETRPDGSTNNFFPLDRLRKYLSKDNKVKKILTCSCTTCQEDRRAIDGGNHIQPLNSLRFIVGEDGDSKDTRKTAFSLFSLLIYVGHPILIIGFLDQDRNDYSLELYPENFKEPDLKNYTRSFASNDKVGFARFASDFTIYRPQFAVRHMDSGKFSRYPPGTILPFIKEAEIGKQLDEDGQWTNIGANGRVFSFEIHGEYRKFPHASEIKRFARKRVETTKFTEHLERANLQSVQSYNDKHIVKLIKAYSLGGVMNLIFPLAKTNLDHLLRNPVWGYANTRGGQLGSCNAWKQLLGIAKALSKIAGVPSDATPTGLSREPNVPHWYGFHFDLKPANILISDDGTWLITDFGQATFTYSSDRTPRVSNQGGTDSYAPPEIDNLNEQFSRRYDVWSLGCILLEVTAFVVLGYDGLRGSSSESGLDQVRHSNDGWSRRTDDRFFYRVERQAEPEVKPDIIKFMEFLKEKVRHLDQRSQQFLADILKLIEDMLQPAVERRIDIGEVIRILEAAITQASSLDDVGQPLQTVAAPGELDIGAPELGLVKLWHWNRPSRIWQPSSLRVFEDLNGNLRFYSLAYNRIPAEMYLRRQRDEILPHYAYWDNEKPQANEAWLGFSNIDSTGVPDMPGAIYAFSFLTDARCVQSKLTYQNIEMSFPLKSVRVKKYVKIGRKVLNAVTNVFHSKDPEAGKFDEKLIEGKDLGPATIQLWTEQMDQVAMKRRENQSISSAAISAKRKPRIQFHEQPGYRDIYPRRAVIYLHRYGCILTVKTEVNWIARVIDNHIMRFQPTKPDRDPHFVASLLQPNKGHIAGLPLCPQVLRQIESENRFEADQFELQFANEDAPQDFNQKYRLMKQAWEMEKEEVEKLQGFTPVHMPPDPYPEPLDSISKRKQKAQSASIHEHYAPDARTISKGKGRAVEPSTLREADGYHNGYGTPQPQVRINGVNETFTSQTLPAPTRRTTMNGNGHVEVKHHRGGGRGAPPKSWGKKPYKKSDTASSESVGKDGFRYG